MSYQTIWTILLTILIIIAIDTFLGILLAIKNRELDARKLPRFLATSVLPYYGGLIILALGALVSSEISALFYAAVAAVTAKYLAEIKDKVLKLFGVAIDDKAGD